MSNSLKTDATMWQAIKSGTFVEDYTKELRTALQKAIDKHNPNVTIENKKTLDEGDLQMFDGKEWVQFCIHKAKKLINNDDLFVWVREFKNGEWVTYEDTIAYKFNESLKDKLDLTPSPNILSREMSLTHDEWHKMQRDFRNSAFLEGRLNVSRNLI